MPNKIANRVKMTVSGTPGTGTITLGSAVAGFQSFAGAGVSNADTVPYIIEDGAAWEIGVGTYTSSGTTMSRSVTASSNSGNAINATSAAIVMISPLAADLQAGTAANNLVALDGSAKLPAVDGSALTNLNAGAATSGTLAVARGGTGLTSLTAGRIPYGAGGSGTDPFGNSANLFWDATNSRLGVGTASPAAKLQVNTGNIRLSDGQQIEWGGSTNSIEGSNASNYLRFWTNNQPRATIDASGNLGLGVTPSAWSGLVASQVGNGSLSSGTSGNNALIASNAYFTGSVWRYITNGNATYYTQFNGTHGWVTAASGTAGNLVNGTGAFTQAMTLDASGRLGIGTISPGRTLSIAGSDTWLSITRNGGRTYLVGTGTDDSLRFFDETAVAERARIDANGNIICGTAAIATNATNGFLYVPGCAGTPTGTPTTVTGRSPIVVDTTNNKLYFYSGGQWRDAGP